MRKNIEKVSNVYFLVSKTALLYFWNVFDCGR